MRPIPLATLVRGATPQAVIACAHEAYARGIRVFKFKLGRPGRWHQEWRTLKHLAEALPLDAKLRIDVNGAWNLDEASRRLQALSAIGPELVEEPVAPNHLDQLAPGLVPIALDESLQGPGWRQRLIAAAARGVCQAIVLKPMALGGMARCLEMAALARSLGITVIVTHLFDGPLGLAAAAELALALGDDIGPCGLDRHCALYAWSPSSVPQVGPSALTAAPGAGLCLSALAFPKQGEMVRL
ncbi:MAG: enolase C-terminal domain-like protein [Terriglobales bacterium]